MSKEKELLQKSNEVLKKLVEHFTKTDIDVLKEALAHQEEVNTYLEGKDTPEVKEAATDVKKDVKKEKKVVPEKVKQKPEALKGVIKTEKKGGFAWDKPEE